MMMQLPTRTTRHTARAILVVAAFLALAACGDSADGTAENGANGAVNSSSPAPTISSGEPNSPNDVAITMEVDLGGDRTTVSGMGTCTHTEEASIYGMNAAQWRVEDSDAESIRHASLTVWRPTSGEPDQFSLSLTTSSGSHSISTVKGGQLVGSGTITMQPMGEGARFDITGEDGEGRPVRASFQCARFVEPVVEGG